MHIPPDKHSFWLAEVESNINISVMREKHDQLWLSGWINTRDVRKHSWCFLDLNLVFCLKIRRGKWERRLWISRKAPSQNLLRSAACVCVYVVTPSARLSDAVIGPSVCLSGLKHRTKGRKQNMLMSSTPEFFLPQLRILDFLWSGLTSAHTSSSKPVYTLLINHFYHFSIKQDETKRPFLPKHVPPFWW